MTEIKLWEEPFDDGYWQSVLSATESAPAHAAPPASSGWARAEQSYAEGQVLELRVLGHNRGGLLVDLGDVRGFVPASQLTTFPRQATDAEREQAFAQYTAQTLRLKVIEFDRAHNRLILSERIVTPPPSRVEQLLAQIQPNEKRSGIVRNVTNFGAFIDLGGVEGLIHVSELSWQYVAHPKDILSPGQQVEVFVVEIDRAQKRIACSLKRLTPNPWDEIAATLKPGAWTNGVVVSVVAFGAFVRVADGVEGLLHISEFAGKDAAHPRDPLQEGQTVQVRVMEIDPRQQKMRLSLRKPNERGNGAEPDRHTHAINPRSVPPPPDSDDAYWESLSATR